MILEYLTSSDARSLLNLLRFPMDGGPASSLIVTLHAAAESRTRDQPKSLEMCGIASSFPAKGCRCRPQFEYGRLISAQGLALWMLKVGEWFGEEAEGLEEEEV